MKRKIYLLMIFALILALCACGKAKAVEPMAVPFAEDADWSWTEDDAKAALGEPTQVLPSVYNGNVLSYTREYLGKSGTLKLMFDGKGKLASIAWAYFTDAPEEIEELTKTVSDTETGRFGSPVSPNSKGTAGSVWYTDNGDVLITSIGVSGSYGFQYSYISREHSAR